MSDNRLPHGRGSVEFRESVHQSRCGDRKVKGAAMFTFSYPPKLMVGRDGRVLVEFVDLPRVATDGKDRREAFEEAMDALGSDLSIRLSRREEIPVPSRAKRGQRMVPVPLWLAPKLALYVAMRDQGVNNSVLARRLGVHERVVRRMMDPRHATKTEKIQAALRVLGKQMTVEVRDAA
jgi:antitoxin HicB